jgi:dolichyl-phosphate-mannose-protein mannosyltransferase
MHLLKTVRAKTAVVIYLVAQIFFLINIQFPVKYDFDEFHYVPAAKEFLSFDRAPNLEHPPLAKMFMAVGIGLFGDRPLGWRIMSTIFGALTLVGMYFWAQALFKNEKYARWVVALTLVNQLLYVQARIGMLDTFMFGFLVWALAWFTQAWDPELDAQKVKKSLMLSGIFFGLATACKWFAVIPWLTCVGLSGLIFMLHSWGVSFSTQTSGKGKSAKISSGIETEFYQAALWKGLKKRDVLIRLGIVPFVFYFVTFIPYAFFSENPISIFDFFGLQIRMWGDQLRVVNSHPYMSQWKDWPLMSRPIWYAFDSDPGGSVRGVLLLGNPVVMWTGLLAILACFWSFFKTRSREAFLISAFYFAFYGSWILIPRKIAFYYYYYPAGMTLSLALAYVFYRYERLHQEKTQAVTIASFAFLGVSVGMFIYFFPILAALKIGAGEFQNWMWFRSWI